MISSRRVRSASPATYLRLDQGDHCRAHVPVRLHQPRGQARLRDRSVNLTDAPVSACPQCSAPVRKVYGSVGVVFKGSGFYRTDSRKAATASERPPPPPRTRSSSAKESSSSPRPLRLPRPPRAAAAQGRRLTAAAGPLRRPQLTAPSTTWPPPAAGPCRRAHFRDARLRRPSVPVHAPAGGGRRAGRAALVLAPARQRRRWHAARTGGRPVTVAATDLPPGTSLGSAGSDGRPAASRVRAFRAAAEPGPLVGRVLAGGVRAGEPVTDARLVGPGLTALLPDGQVAAPVVSPTSRSPPWSAPATVWTSWRPRRDSASAEVVAAGALVLAAAHGADAVDDPAAGLLLIAVDASDRRRLAAAATTDTLTVSLPPP